MINADVSILELNISADIIDLVDTAFISELDEIAFTGSINV